MPSFYRGRRWAKNEKMSHETVSGQSFSPVILGTVQLYEYLGTDTVQCTTGTSTGKTGAISRPASRHVTGVARNSGVPGMLCTNQACSKACSSSAAALCDQITAARRQRLRYGTVKMVLRFKQPCQQPRDTSPGLHVTPVFLACCVQTKHAARPARAQLPRYGVG